MKNKLNFIITIIGIVVGLLYIPTWWKLNLFLFDFMMTYPILWLSLLGVPFGVWVYFRVYPDDIQKVKSFFKCGVGGEQG